MTMETHLLSNPFAQLYVVDNSPLQDAYVIHWSYTLLSSSSSLAYFYGSSSASPIYCLGSSLDSAFRPNLSLQGIFALVDYFKFLKMII